MLLKMSEATSEFRPRLEVAGSAAGRVAESRLCNLLVFFRALFVPRSAARLQSSVGCT